MHSDYIVSNELLLMLSVSYFVAFFYLFFTLIFILFILFIYIGLGLKEVELGLIGISC